MEVYILDSLLRRTAIFDVFESMIWTERWQDVGDFELHIKSSFDTRSQFAPGVRIAINESYRVMTVETVEDTTDADGKSMLKITGKSLEAILDDRVARDENITDLTAHPTWDISDTPGNIVRIMVSVRTGAAAYADASDTIGYDHVPYMLVSDDAGLEDLFPPGTLAEPANAIPWKQAPDTLLNVAKKICTLYDLGFRIVRNPNASELIFNVYTGNDRTTRQTDLPPVVFATTLDNLQNTTEFSTIEQSKNVAYVYSDVGTAVVLGTGVDPDIAGFDRRVMFVDASSQVDATTPDIPGALDQIGQEALSQNRASSYFDGELNQDSEYKYGVDYQVGDLVELRNVDGVVTYKRVSEQIFVSDSQGERSYPTLAMDMFVGVTSWLSYGNKTTVWLDFDSEATTWADM